MIKRYGIPGESQETRTDLDLGSPYILMQSDRPQPHYVATGSGEWIGPPDPVPEEVTMAQCRLALFDMTDIKNDAQFFGLVDLLPEEERERALLELRTRATVRRDNTLVVSLAVAMGWDLDALFRYAAIQ